MVECRICHKDTVRPFEHALGSFCGKKCFKRLIDTY